MGAGSHIAVLGAGSVGGYVGARLTLAGEDVSLIDSWPEHVDYMKREGLHISDSRGAYQVPVHAMHVCEVQTLIRKPVDIALVCSNSYDTEWMATLIRQYLAPEGYLVSVQNGMNEECIARIVGWERTVGCIASTISVNCHKPGHISRFKAAVNDAHTVFRVGEPDGTVSSRISELARILSAVDSAEVTQHLRAERWTKLAANAITHALLGATGLTNEEVLVKRGAMYRIGVKLAAEAVALGKAQGYVLGPVLGVSPDDWLAAGNGDAAAMRRVDEGLMQWTAGFTEFSRSSVGRDVAKGRRTEVDFTNGLIAAKGRELGVAAPTHAALTALMRRIDRGELKPDAKNVEGLAD